MPFTDTYANSILGLIFGKGSVTAPAEVWIGLTSGGSEISGGGYSRVLVFKKGQTYPDLIGAASARKITNKAQINWTKATADWPLVDGFIVTDAQTYGTTIFYGDLDLTDEQKAVGGLHVEAGSVALFDPEKLTIEFPATDTDNKNTGTVVYAVRNLGDFEAHADYGYHYKSVTPAPFTLTVGKTYTVVWDGAEHTCTAQDSSAAMAGTVFIGNGTDFTFAGNGEPFAIVASSTDVTIFAIGSTDSTHSCIVYQVD